ncbi:lipocalin-like domain-containing protein [Flavobacterium selenitireducens]|uniref:lipocalin family protein n=1 Tax=Flavobacterium selenitireducens TaxID=2722704 RepID=UPI00168A6A33|nr:lipocalin family protein [Flavobacterium selenitireducens]MBD3582571.1 lipocalin family protein [Flavobacterium selenitireducens]
MKHLTALIVFSLFLISCQTKISREQMAHLNGYWQIEKVMTADGEQKDYQANTSYDFFEINGDKGFRAKVMPQLDGSFITNNLKEQILVTYEQDGTFLNYVTQYAKWREQIKTLTEDELVVENAQKIEYHYKKAGPINLD